DDFLKSISSYTAFSRLIHLLGDHFNNEKAKVVLHPDKLMFTEPHFAWPSSSNEQWIKIERHIEELILRDFGRCCYRSARHHPRSGGCHTLSTGATDGQIGEEHRRTSANLSCLKVCSMFSH
ncbi:PRP8 domain IV core-domain-containing protein, partial [Panaeolus papilionaceus]